MSVGLYDWFPVIRQSPVRVLRVSPAAAVILTGNPFKVTANEELVSKDFLFYLLKYLKSHFIQIASNKQTTGLGHVTIADLKRMSVVIPNKDIQNKVVAFIKPIDDQIQVNNEINKNLAA